MQSQQHKKKKYDFTLSSDKSKQDVTAYFKKHGWTETLYRLKESAGKLKVVSIDQITKYTFSNYKGTVILYEDIKNSAALIGIVDQTRKSNQEKPRAQKF